MDNKSLIKQLNNLHITPDHGWKEKNRELLMSQIQSAQTEHSRLHDFGFFFVQTFDTVFAKPVVLVMSIIVLVMTGGFAGVRAAKDSRPGDSLYIAKTISERAQYASTFNQDDKARLNMKFAQARAEEIAIVMESSDSEEVKQETVNKLNEGFKKQIISARKNLTSKISKNTETKTEQNKNSESEKIVVADFGKEDRGISISDSAPTSSEAARALAQKAAETEKLLEDKQYDKAIENLGGVEEASPEQKEESKDDATNTATSTDNKILSN